MSICSMNEIHIMDRLTAEENKLNTHCKERKIVNIIYRTFYLLHHSFICARWCSEQKRFCLLIHTDNSAERMWF
jgi:hypothetical protein